jgi:high-affinity iron transporter
MGGYTRLLGRWCLAGLLAVVFLFGPAPALAATPQQDVQRLDREVGEAQQALAAGDLATARQAYQEFEDSWPSVEDSVRAVDRDQYRAIEAAMRDVRRSLLADPADTAAATAALGRLHDTNTAFVQTDATATQQPPQQDAASSDSDRLRALVGYLDTARDDVARHDQTAALGAIKNFENNWPAIEGLVRAKSPAAYTATEDDMAQAEALLRAQPARESDADAVLARMRDRLEPLVVAGASYGVFDAFVIMLREGLEALLVIGALTAFLRRSGNADKQSWIWGGAGVGILLSVVLAIVLQQVFQRAGASLGSEMVEGWVGLIAAAMLFYMSYWLHSKARLGAWQTYIREKSTAALAGGSMLSLTIIALLAVFREGAETAVFYLGIAPSISPGDLLLGLASGVAALVAIGAALLLVGMRLPLRPFFLASSALIYYLGFKFVGTGLHALQVAGVLQATPGPLPSSDALGVYPTWETALPQIVLLIVAGVVIWVSLRPRLGRAPASISPAG